MSETKERRYEIDALRVIALVLLIIYHIFICYQPFAHKLQFLQYEKQLTQYWVIGDLLNIWRIPVLFVIAGIAVGFVLRNRTVKEVFIDRMIRLVPPLLFVWFILAPLFPMIYAIYHGDKPVFRIPPIPSHLWFVQNLVSYTFLLLPIIFWVKKQPGNLLIRALTPPVGFFIALIIPLMIEATIFKPGSNGFAFFPLRFWYGFVCYSAGFLLVSTGGKFWKWLRLFCHIALPIALLFFFDRIKALDWLPGKPANWSIALESGMWMLAFLGYGSLLLNRPTKIFAYFNKAVFPIYIIHMLVQQTVALVIFRWNLSGEITFLIHVVLTLAICWLCYEYIIKRIRFLYPIMGMKLPSKIGEPIGGLTKFGTAFTSYVLGPVIFLLQIAFVGIALLTQFAGTNKPEPKPSDSLWMAAKNNDINNKSWKQRRSPLKTLQKYSSDVSGWA